MTDHEHETDHDHETDHEHGEEHDHHHHTYDWQSELLALREAATHYYEHEFDWRGYAPPEDFDGPKYFPPEPAWRLAARLDSNVEGAGDHAEVPTSTGQIRHMHVAGDVVFEKDGAEHRLLAYVSDRDGQEVLFVPFRDATSGTETYGAGRYVEAFPDPDAPDGPIELDFNYAYNPSCVFSPAYDCPYPPARNRLSVPVRAGERLPFDAH